MNTLKTLTAAAALLVIAGAAQAQAPAAPAAPIPGAPSPQKIQLAQKIQLSLMMLGYPVPPDIAATAAWDITTAEAVRDAQIKALYAPTTVAPQSASTSVATGRRGTPTGH
jgi:hypothetical protein